MECFIRFSIFSAMRFTHFRKWLKFRRVLWVEVFFSKWVSDLFFLVLKIFYILFSDSSCFRQFHWFSTNLLNQTVFNKPFFLPLGRERKFWVRVSRCELILSFWAECNGVENFRHFDCFTLFRTSVTGSYVISSTSIFK